MAHSSGGSSHGGGFHGGVHTVYHGGGFGATAEHSVKLVFLNKEEADSFRGLIIDPDCNMY